MFVIILFFISGSQKDVKVAASYKSTCPWLVLMTGQDLICGGIILNETTILTAAHCVYNQKSVTVYPGVVDRMILPKGYKALKILVHNAFDVENLYNDVALVILKRKIAFSPKVYAISLPFCSPAAGIKAWVSGFGVTDNGQLSRMLRTFEVTTQVSNYCILKYGDDFNSKLQICAGNLYKSLDFCTGDSGGPLYCKQNNVWVAIGIVSFTGKQCADGLPSVYTDIFGYISWIQQYL